MNRRERLSDWWDGVTASASLRWPLLARAYAYRGLRKDRGYSRRVAFKVARGMTTVKRP